MPNGLPIPPDRWPGEIGGPRRTLEEAQAAINNDTCIGRVTKEIHPYETILQGIFNWLKTTATGLGAERSISEGTSLVTRFFCFTDTQLQQTRTRELSNNITIDKKCVLHATAVRQKEQQFTRKWERWTVTAVSKDDPESAIINGVVSTLIALLGLPATGPATASFTAGASLSFADLFEAMDSETIFVSHSTAADETVWKAEGAPKAHVLASIQLDPELCKFLRQWYPQTSEETGAPVGTSESAEQE